MTAKGASLAVVELPGQLTVSRRGPVVSMALQFLLLFAVGVLPLLVLSGLWVTGPVGMLLVAFGLLRRRMKLLRDWNSGITDAAALLRLHELDEAERLLTQLAKATRSLGVRRAPVVAYLAVVARLKGRLPEAKVTLAGLIANTRMMRAAEMAYYVGDIYAEMGLVCALRGELDDAADALARGEAHVAKATTSRLVPLRSTNLLGRAIMLTRRQQFSACLEMLAGEGVGARELLRPHDARVVALVEGLCLTRYGGGYRAGAEHRALSEALVDSRSRRPGEFDYLADAWPQMRTFLETHVEDAN